MNLKSSLHFYEFKTRERERELYILELNLWEHLLFTPQPYRSHTERQHSEQANIHIASGAQVIEHTPDAVDNAKDSLT